MYYFAYGSNLNIAQMKRRCPKATKFGPMILPNARLVFKRVADVEYHETETVTGGLWKITKECEKELDRYEGSKPDGKGLYRKEYLTIEIVVKGVPKQVRALIYVMNRDYYTMPMTNYLTTIRQGFKDFGLDEAFLAGALKATTAECKVQQTKWVKEQSQQRHKFPTKQDRADIYWHGKRDFFEDTQHELPEDETDPVFEDADGEEDFTGYPYGDDAEAREFQEWLKAERELADAEQDAYRRGQQKRHDKRCVSGYKQPNARRRIEPSVQDDQPFDWAAHGFDPIKKAN